MSDINKYFCALASCLLLAVAVLASQKQTQAQKPPLVVDNRMAMADMETVKAAREYKASLEKLLKFEEDDVKVFAETLEKRKVSLAENAIDKEKVDESEQALITARAKVAETQKQIADVDKLIAEAINGPLFAPVGQTKQPVKAVQSQTNRSRRSATSGGPPPTATARTARAVTINVKHGAPVHGMFIGADDDAVQVEVESAQRLTIGMDEIISIVFVTLDAPRASASPAPRVGEEGRAAAADALKALRALDSALEIGMNKRDYTNRLIDVKLVVEQAQEKMDSGNLKAELQAALDDYAEASNAWSYFINGSRFYSLASNPGVINIADPMVQIFLRKYPAIKTFGTGAGGFGPYVNTEGVLHGIWGSAKRHIEKAAALFGDVK
jgi:hypothetical protein